MLVVIPQAPQLWNGYFPFLQVTRDAAAMYGNQTEVFEPFPCAAVDEFRKHYRPGASPNSPWFQQWCFEQWLLLAEWMVQSHTDVVFKIDSDCLVFADLQQVWDSIGRPDSTAWVPDSFVTARRAMEISDYLIETFRLGMENELNTSGSHVSDQQLIGPFVKSSGAKDLSAFNLMEMIDNNLFVTRTGMEYEGHKDIWFVQGVPCWIRPSGITRMFTLHCWGAAKKKMDAIWHQSRLSIGGPPVRLTLC